MPDVGVPGRGPVRQVEHLVLVVAQPGVQRVHWIQGSRKRWSVTSATPVNTCEPSWKRRKFGSVPIFHPAGEQGWGRVR